MFDPPVKTALSGRKYICAGCVTDAADTLGLFDKFKTAHDEQEARVKIVEGRLEAYAHLEEALARFPKIEKIVEVEKIVEKPVEKIVEVREDR